MLGFFKVNELSRRNHKLTASNGLLDKVKGKIVEHKENIIGESPESTEL